MDKVCCKQWTLTTPTTTHRTWADHSHDTDCYCTTLVCGLSHLVITVAATSSVRSAYTTLSHLHLALLRCRLPVLLSSSAVSSTTIMSAFASPAQQHVVLQQHQPQQQPQQDEPLTPRRQAAQQRQRQQQDVVRTENFEDGEELQYAQEVFDMLQHITNYPASTVQHQRIVTNAIRERQVKRTAETIPLRIEAEQKFLHAEIMKRKADMVKAVKALYRITRANARIPALETRLSMMISDWQKLQMTEKQKMDFLFIEQQTKQRRLQLEAMTREMRGSLGANLLPSTPALAQIVPTDAAAAVAVQASFGGFEADDISRSLRQFSLAPAGRGTHQTLVDNEDGAEGMTHGNDED